MYADGQKVSFVGDPSPDTPAIGDVGIVVSAGNTASHVRWMSGVRAGLYDEMGHMEIAATASTVTDTDSFSGRIVTFSVAEVQARAGARGLLDELNDRGHLGGLEAIAEEAMGLVAARIRTDPSIREVLAQLDDEDGDDLVALATVALLQDAFGRE